MSKILEQDGCKFSYSSISLLGNGSFGEVSKGRIEGGKPVAVKTSKKEVVSAKHEYNILKSLNGSPYFVKVFGSRYEETTRGEHMFSFAMELGVGSVASLMEKPTNKYGLDILTLLDFIMDAAGAMKVLQEKKLGHRDIKDMNIIYFHSTKSKERRFSPYKFKFCDMGFARKVNDMAANELSSIVGTTPYLLPNVRAEFPARKIQKWKYSAEACDFWSLGCTLYRLSSGKYSYWTNIQGLDNTDVIAVYKTENRFTPITDLPNKDFSTNMKHSARKYPKWFAHVLTRLIRSCQYQLDSQVLHNVAESIRKSPLINLLDLQKGKRTMILDFLAPESPSADFFKETWPTLREILDYDVSTDITLMSRTKVYHLDSRDDPRVQEDTYLVIPKGKNLERPSKPDATINEENRSDEMSLKERRRLVGIAKRILESTDDQLSISQEAKHILEANFDRLQKKLSTMPEMPQIIARFSGYLEIAKFVMFTMTEGKLPEQLESALKSTETARHNSTRMIESILNDDESCRTQMKKLKDLDLNDIAIDRITEELDELPLGTSGNGIDEINETSPYALSLLQLCKTRWDHVYKQIYEKNGYYDQLLGCFSKLDHLSSREYLTEDAQLELAFQTMKDTVNKITAEHNIDLNNILTYMKNADKKASKYIKMAAGYRSMANEIRQLNLLLEIQGKNEE